MVLFILLSGCGLKEGTLKEFYKGDLNEVSKIIIVDGNTGERATSTDEEQINLFLDDIHDVKFIPEENQNKRDGFNYSITLYQNEEETFQFGNTEIEGDYYYTTPDIKPIIDDFYSSIKENPAVR